MKNKILRGFTRIVLLIAVFNACLLDSRSNIPIIILYACLAWLGLYALVNHEWYDKNY